MTYEDLTITRSSTDGLCPPRRTLTDTLDDIDRALHDLGSQSDHLHMLIDRARGLADALHEGRGS